MAAIEFLIWGRLGKSFKEVGLYMKIIDFYASDDKEHWLSEIQKSDWSAGKYLYELLRDKKLKGLCGESTKVLLLVDNSELLSFCTYAVKDRGTEKMADIADLMEIFTLSDKYDYKKFPRTSERKNQLKNTEEGVRTVSEGIQELIDKGKKEQEQETILTAIRNVMEALGVGIEKAMDILKVPQNKRASYVGMI